MRPNCCAAGVRHRLHRVGVGDVADMDQRLAACGLDLARDDSASARLLRALTTMDAPPSAKRQRDRAADIAARAGDDGDLAIEFLHLLPCAPLNLTE